MTAANLAINRNSASRYANDPLVTYLGWAQRRGVEVLTGAKVSRVLHDGTGRARGVEYYSNGQRHEQYADLVILAASFVQNPRILLYLAIRAGLEAAQIRGWRIRADCWANSYCLTPCVLPTDYLTSPRRFGWV